MSQHYYIIPQNCKESSPLHVINVKESATERVQLFVACDGRQQGEPVTKKQISQRTAMICRISISTKVSRPTRSESKPRLGQTLLGWTLKKLQVSRLSPKIYFCQVLLHPLYRHFSGFGYIFGSRLCCPIYLRKSGSVPPGEVKYNLQLISRLSYLSRDKFETSPPGQ